MQWYEWKSKTIVTVVSDIGRLNFYINLDTVEYIYDKIHDKMCYIAYAECDLPNDAIKRLHANNAMKHLKANNSIKYLGVWITSDSKDMKNCYSFQFEDDSSKEYECDDLSRIHRL